ncbi:MAG: phenylacetate--CoA ligase family protein [Gammaproteobacteria bacterium]
MPGTGRAVFARLANGLPAVAWPVIPTPAGAGMLALLHQLDASQWWDAARLERHQHIQLARLLAHARRTVPFFEERLAGYDVGIAVPSTDFAHLPRLSRDEVHDHGDALRSRVVPPAHGALVGYVTSGSSGHPLRVAGTRLHGLFWRALVLRDHLWHRRDFGGRLAVLKASAGDVLHANWGAATAGVFETGPSASFSSSRDVAEQAAWLHAQDPDYLLGYPSNLGAVLGYCRDQGFALPRLREVRSFGEALPADLRAFCQAELGVPLTDSYSAAEVGVIALQCPHHDHYHVQSEHLLVEILHPDGRRCAPGEQGRVVVTPLHNFAMPLIRYELNDYAEVGPPCPCGRGLPVITRILGRRRHMLRLPDGSRHWPSFPAELWQPCPAIRQFQLVQIAPDAITLRLVVTRPLTPDEFAALGARLSARLGWPFRYEIEYCEQLAERAGFEDFVSVLDEP